jgi:lysozyme
MRPLPQICVDFVKRHEGCRLTAYQDSGGVWTIGFGSTGPTIFRGLQWTQEEADAALVRDLDKAAQTLTVTVGRPVINEMNDNQYSALVSFVFNAGVKSQAQIWNHVRNLDWNGVSQHLMMYVNVDGKPNHGLENRRKDEIALMNSAK